MEHGQIETLINQYKMIVVTKLDRIRNDRNRGTTKVGERSKKVQESRWNGHVLRREDEYVGKRVMAMEMPGKRRKGRPKQRWLDSIRNDLSERTVRGGRARPSAMEASYKKHRPNIKVGKDAEEEVNQCKKPHLLI